MLEIRDLKLVLAIHAHGSFARAARVLGVGQPALTRQVASLEQRLGAELFVRRSQGVIPTDLCRVLIADAEDIVSRTRRLHERVGQARGEPAGELDVVAGGYATETVAMQAVARMLATRPEVQIRFAVMNWTLAAARVRDREAEVALLEVSELTGGDDLIVEPLRQHPCWFAARQGHPLGSRERVSLSEIFEFPLCYIGRMPERVLSRFIDARQLGDRGLVYPTFPAVAVESPSAALLVVRSSDAVVPVTRAIAAAWLKSGEITLLPWQEPWASTNFGLVYLRQRPISPAMRSFMECVRLVDEAAYADAVPMTGNGERRASGDVDAMLAGQVGISSCKE